MKNNFNETKEDFYANYATLAKEHIPAIEDQQSRAFVNQKSFELLTEEGFWRLPVNQKFGGAGLTWRACINAIEGFVSIYCNPDFISLLVTQLSALYLVCRYGNEEQNKLVLPALAQGTTAIIDIIDNNHGLEVQFNDHIICFKIGSSNPIYADFLHFKKLLHGILAIGFSLSLIEKQNVQASKLDFNKDILSSRDVYYAALDSIDGALAEKLLEKT